MHSTMTNPRPSSLTLIATAPPHIATPHRFHPPFLITFTLFSLWQNEMGHSAVAAFQHSLCAEIPLHKQCLIAVHVEVCVHVCVCVFHPGTLLCYQRGLVELSHRDLNR